MQLGRGKMHQGAHSPVPNGTQWHKGAHSPVPSGTKSGLTLKGGVWYYICVVQ